GCSRYACSRSANGSITGSSDAIACDTEATLSPATRIASPSIATTSDARGVCSALDVGSLTPGTRTMTSPSATELLSRNSSSTVKMSIIEIRLTLELGLRPLRNRAFRFSRCFMSHRSLGAVGESCLRQPGRARDVHDVDQVFVARRRVRDDLHFALRRIVS